MIHWITPDFPMSFSEDRTYRLRLNPHIFDLIFIRSAQPIRLQFDQLAYRDLDVDEAGTRFAVANTSYPGIVVQDQTYRLIDGRHRVKKLMRAGETGGLFYVLTAEDIKPFLEPMSVNTGRH